MKPPSANRSQLLLDLGPALRCEPRGPEPPRAAPFHYTNAMWKVVRDVVATLEEFRHVDLQRVALAIAQARQKSEHGTYASCFPLRFEGGAVEQVVGRRRFRMPELRLEGREMLYILYFVLPRFHDEQDYRGKLATLIHELYHISPEFNGDIRRFPGKNFAHGHSRERYHLAMCVLADRYLANSPRAQQWEFLRAPFSELSHPSGSVVGVSIRRPAPFPVGKV